LNGFIFTSRHSHGYIIINQRKYLLQKLVHKEHIIDFKFTKFTSSTPLMDMIHNVGGDCLMEMVEDLDSYIMVNQQFKEG